MSQNDALRDLLAEAIYAGGDQAEWLTTVDGSPNAASYELADRVLAVLRPAKGQVNETEAWRKPGWRSRAWLWWHMRHAHLNLAGATWRCSCGSTYPPEGEQS
ncbi:MAG: hypothetical protein HOV97_05695 [Nonomuraea sp.]|nr:hypothetical protein [Nonomuraea sp.]